LKTFSLPDSGPRRRRYGRPASALLALGCALLAPSATFAQDDERAAVQAVVDRLFDGMRDKDEALLRSVFAPKARLGTEETGEFIASVVASERHLDEVTFDETILIDEDLAMAWTPYNLFIDGAFHHCGVDLFVLRRATEGWLISQLDDTRRTEGCDPARR